MRFQLWTQHVHPPHQPLRLLSTSDDIETPEQRDKWLSGKTGLEQLEDHEDFMVCTEYSEYFLHDTMEAKGDGKI